MGPDSTAVFQTVVVVLSTIAVSLLGGLVAWIATDFRTRLANLEQKTSLCVTALFYLAMASAGVPQETKEALKQAMGIRQ